MTILGGGYTNLMAPPHATSAGNEALLRDKSLFPDGCPDDTTYRGQPCHNQTPQFLAAEMQGCEARRQNNTKEVGG